MAYNFSHLKEKAKGVTEWLTKENGQIRTGRATPTLLDSIQVESYGSRVPIAQIGSISVEDPRTLRISPWDMTQAKDIEKAIIASGSGLSPVLDDRGVRVIFPELTSERRTLLIKNAKEKLEQAKISLRQVRDEVWDDIQTKEKKKEIGEDEKFRLKTEMQKIIDETTKQLEALKERKEKEIAS